MMFCSWLLRAVSWCRRYWVWILVPTVGVIAYLLGRRRPVVVPAPQADESKRIDATLTAQEQAATQRAADRHAEDVQSLEELVDESIEQLHRDQEAVATQPPSQEELNKYLISVGKRVQ